MKIVWSGALAVPAALAVAMAASGGSGQRPVLDPTVVASIARTERDGRLFRLQVDGLDAGCLVAAADGAGKRPLSVGAACLDAVPSLAGARWWSEREDGSVAFVTDDGHVAAEFAVADGAAFESYAPRWPIMTLLER